MGSASAHEHVIAVPASFSGVYKREYMCLLCMYMYIYIDIRTYIDEKIYIHMYIYVYTCIHCIAAFVHIHI